jgi:hypothetical protein
MARSIEALRLRVAAVFAGRTPAVGALCLCACLACGDDVAAGGAGRGSAGRPGDGGSREGGVAARSASCEGGRTRTFYRDDDGDGFGVSGPTGVHGCAGDVFTGLADNARDCDDTNPVKHEALFVDADGDGFGRDERACVGLDAGGFSRRSDDCDDADPKRSPAADEAWFDGFDADCDGQDNPAGCIAAPGVPRQHYATADVAELPALDRIPVDTAPDCEGSADLYLAIAGGCPICSAGLATVVVANAGEVAAAFRVTTNAGSVDVSDALAPGAAAEPLSLSFRSPGSVISVSALGGVADCRRGNDSKTVSVGFVDCASP